MTKILFDSDVLIEYLRDNPGVTREMELLAGSDALLAITPVTEAEIRRGLRSHEKEKTEQALNSFHCLDLTRPVGQRAGEYLRKYAKSHGLEIADALIAASAAVHKFSLCTFNWKHYPMSEIQRRRLDRF